MIQSKPKNKRGDTKSPQGIEQLLSEQTTVILEAVDHRLDKQKTSLLTEMDRRFDAQDKRIDERFAAQNIAILTAVDKRFEKMEQRFMEKLNSLTNTLDHFLKRLTDTEEEFVYMKHDVNRIKAVLREKLGVAID